MSAADRREQKGDHFEHVVAKLEAAGARYYAGDDWYCPGHDDGTRGSLGIRELRDGSVLMHCMGGCQNKSLFLLAGLDYPSDFYPRTRQRYIYRDASGEPRYCVIRYYKGAKKNLIHKVFEPDHEQADKLGFAAYKGCMQGVEKVLYGLPKVAKQAADAGTVIIVGGEKDARAAWNAWGLVATTNSAGESARWQQGYTESLRGLSEVVIVPDKDGPGHKHAAMVYDALTDPETGLGEETLVRIAQADVDVKGADLADHIANGKSFEELVPIERDDLEASVELFDVPDFSDAKNAERFELLYGKSVRYVNHQKIWLVWDGTRWANNKPEVRRMALRTVRKLRDEILEMGDRPEYQSEEAQKNIQRWLVTVAGLQSAQRLKALLEVAEVIEGISTYPSDYDQDPWALNVLNGTLDLRSGKLRPHNRGDLNRKLAPVEFDPKATAPTFKAFLERIVPDSGVRKFLCFYIGMSLTGAMEEHIFPVLYGKGRNGKSTFVRVIRELLGEYAQSLPSDTLKVKSFGGGIPNDIARLDGVRLSMTMEFPEGERINEDLLKRLTGGDQITARFLNQEYFDFYPTAKFLLGTNHKPEFRGTDEGIWRRVRLVPFNQQLTLEEVDTKLPAKLSRELSGILNWALRGVRGWQREGLITPELMETETAEYREESDLLGQFLTEMCVSVPMDVSGVVEPGINAVMATDLYAAFKQWMEDRSSRAWTQTTFGRAISGRPGIEKKHHSKTRRAMYLGIKMQL